MLGCGGGDNNKQSNDNTVIDETSQSPSNVPVAPQPDNNVSVAPQPDNVDTNVSSVASEKINAAFNISVTPSNYEANSYLTVEHRFDFNKVNLSLPEANDLVLKCSWMIKEKEISDSCSYQLSGNEHFYPITISTYLQSTKGLKTETSTMVIQRAFPITHRKTPSGDAMLMSDGRIISWNTPEGADLNEASTKLLPDDVIDSRSFFSLSANKSAFIAIDKNGKIVTWGNRKQGGETPEYVSAKKIKQVAASDYAFSALSDDGKVYLWGHLNELKSGQEIPISGHVTELYGLSDGFVALTTDGNAYGFGVDIPLTSQDVGSIKKVVSTSHRSIHHKYSMAVLNNSGHVYMWGNYADKLPELDSVVDINSTSEAYAALKKNGDVVVWGDPAHGGEFKYSLHKREYVNGKFTRDTVWTAIQPPKNVTKLVASNSAFSALQRDGKVIAWGDGFAGGNIYSVEPNNQVINKSMSDIYANEGGFIGVDSNSNMTIWGYWWITDENLVSYDAVENPNWKSNIYDAIGKGEYKNFTSNSASFAFSISNKNSSELFSVGRDEIGGSILREGVKDIKSVVTKMTSHECGYSAFTSSGDVYGWFGCEGDSRLKAEYKAKPYEILKQ